MRMHKRLTVNRKRSGLEIMAALNQKATVRKGNMGVNMEVKRRRTVLKNKLNGVVNQDVPYIWVDMWYLM